MKHLIVLLLISVSISAAAQETGKVYLIRPYNYTGWAISFKCFVDDTLVCKIKNAKHSIHDVEAGEHIFSVQRYGDENKNEGSFKLNIEAGKTYYLQMTLANKLILQEVNEISATPILQATKLFKDCL